MTGPDLLERIDRAIAELQAIRAELAASTNVDIVHIETPAYDDLAPNLIDSFACQERFGHPADTVRKWARETAGTEQAIGVMRGGRWLIDPRRLRQRLNGK